MADNEKQKTRSATNLEDLKKLIVNMDKKLSDTKDSLTEKMGDVSNKLETFMSSITKEVVETKQRVTEMEKTIEHLNGEVDELKTSICMLRADFDLRCREIESNMTLKELHDRKKNLLFYGIPEKTAVSTENVVRNFLQKELKLKQDHVDRISFGNVHRIPRRRYSEEEETDPRPPVIIASFVYMPDRDTILRAASRNLPGTGKSVRTDLPTSMKQHLKKAYEIRQQQGLYTKIRVMGIDVVLEVKGPKEPNTAWRRLHIPKE